MASRNVSACDNDEESDSEVTSLMSGAAAASLQPSVSMAKPLVHYGDRMPYRQGKRLYTLIMLLVSQQ